MWYYLILRNIHVWQHMVTSHFQLSMEWSKYKYIIFYQKKCCKDSIDTGKFTANHKQSNIHIRNLPLNEIPLLYHYRSRNFAHSPPFCTIRQLTYRDCALISAKMNRHLTLVYKGYLTTHFPMGNKNAHHIYFLSWSPKAMSTLQLAGGSAFIPFLQ